MAGLCGLTRSYRKPLVSSAGRLLWRSGRLLLLGLLLVLLLAQPALAEEPSRINIGPIETTEFPNVKVYLDVTDARGLPIPGLSVFQFEVIENGARVTNLEVVPAVDAKVSLGVALILDTSGSMKGQPMEDAKRVATDFVTSLQGKETVALLTVAPSGNVVQDFTNDREKVKSAISSLKAEGDTALYDALRSALELAAKQENKSNVLVLLSDGQDTMSKTGFDEVLALVRQRYVTIFSVGFGPQADFNVLKRLAEVTGGTSFQASSAADLARAFQTIASRVGKYHLLSYTSPKPRAGQERLLTVNLRQQDKTISASRDFQVRGAVPSVVISYPKPDEVVLREMSVVLAVDNPQQVAEVQLWIDNRLLGKLTEPPYSWQVNTADLPEGNHSLMVLAKGFGPGEVHKQIWFSSVLPARDTGATQPEPQPVEFSLIDWLKERSQVLFKVAVLLVAFGFIGVGIRGFLPLSDRYCPACGRKCRGGQGCPSCQVEGGAFSRPRRLGEILVASNIIDEITLRSALVIGQATHRRLGEVLLKRQVAQVPAIRAAIRLQAANSSMALRAATLASECQPALTPFALAIYATVIALGLLLASYPFIGRW